VETLDLQVDFNVKGYHPRMRIGEVAKRSGLSATTVRYYEDIGLLPQPARAANGYRDYEPEAVERLRFVRDAQDSGLTLAEISSILELRAQGESTCHHTIELMERHLEDVDRRIESLRASRDVYAKLIARAITLDPTDCTDPDRCQTISTALDSVSAGVPALAGDWRDEDHGRHPQGSS
jgi:DNA-binding transcriptional MerR regulator